VMFSFVDGQYQEVGTLTRPFDFFLDPSGDVVLFYNNDYDGMYGYFYVRFVDNDVNIIPLPEWDDYQFDWLEWNAHHSHPYFHVNPTIFGRGAPLTRIYPLDELANKIAEQLRLGYR